MPAVSRFETAALCLLYVKVCIYVAAAGQKILPIIAAKLS